MALKSSFSLALIMTLMLTGCTFNPFTPRNQFTGNVASTAAGAGIAGGLAWLAGASRPLILASGIGGAALGYYVSTLRFASAGVLQQCGQVFTMGCDVMINIPTDQLFDTNSADFLEDACPVLDSVVNVLNRYPNNNIIVSGNTSGFGVHRFDHKLSEDRARQVAAYLWAHGVGDYQYQSIQTRKLTYVGYGNYFPIANDLHNCSLRQNSHIQITAYLASEQLEIDRRYNLDNKNIGSIDECPTSCTPCSSAETHCANQFAAAFPEDFKGVIHPGASICGNSHRPYVKKIVSDEKVWNEYKCHD